MELDLGLVGSDPSQQFEFGLFEFEVRAPSEPSLPHHLYRRLSRLALVRGGSGDGLGQGCINGRGSLAQPRSDPNVMVAGRDEETLSALGG